ncbi:hypothetical protein [Myxococcus phage Mx1]|nr:hypothetical protein [Myxococcus phage Mx1]
MTPFAFLFLLCGLYIALTLSFFFGWKHVDAGLNWVWQKVLAAKLALVRAIPWASKTDLVSGLKSISEALDGLGKQYDETFKQLLKDNLTRMAASPEKNYEYLLKENAALRGRIDALEKKLDPNSDEAFLRMAEHVSKIQTIARMEARKVLEAQAKPQADAVLARVDAQLGFHDAQLRDSLAIFKKEMEIKYQKRLARAHARVKSLQDGLP